VNSVTIYVCENQPVLVEGLRRILQDADDLQLVGQASDIGIAIAELAGINVDILLLGQPFSAKSILPLLGQIREADIQVPIVLWVGELSEMDSFRALQMGARGILRKTQAADTLLECLRSVASGSVYVESVFRSPVNSVPRRNGVLRITPREREIVEFICRGMKNKEIAEALSITPGTVKVHLMHIFEKTGVKDRFQLALQGRQFLSTAEGPIALRKTLEA
jgi:two-component system nitrate/nitrite response regulator NarL